MADIEEIAIRTAAEIALAYRRGEAGPVAVAECLLDRIEAVRADNAFITVTAERALAEARLRSDKPLSALDGVPVAWKDNIDVAGAPTTAGSRLLKRAAKPRDQACVTNAAAAGLVCLGKLNMTELAYSGLGLNPHYGTPRNRAPHEEERHATHYQRRRCPDGADLQVRDAQGRGMPASRPHARGEGPRC